MSVPFDDDCAWPRRLVHIPTMTSYRWAPGNRYGPQSNPKYAILSYTWGRWRLKSHEMPHIQAWPVAGVTWDIPRVKPTHFTVSDLENTIRQLPLLAKKVREEEMRSMTFFGAIAFVCGVIVCEETRDER